MKAILMFLLCFAVILPSVAKAQDVLKRVKTTGKLVVGVKSDYPPWGMLGSDGKHAGFEIDLARAVANSLGVQVSFKTVTTANRFQKLNDGEVDFLVATVGDSMIRREKVNMVLPHYFKSGVTILAHNGSGIEAWEDLIGRPVCITAGAYFNKFLMDNYRIRPVMFLNNRDLKIALLTGKCDAWAYDSGILFHLQQQPEWDNFTIPLETINPIHWSFVTRKDEHSVALSDWLAHFIASRIRDGYLKQLASRWKLPEQDYLAQLHANWNEINSTGSQICRVGDSNLTNSAFCFDEVPKFKKQHDLGWLSLDDFDTRLLSKAILHTIAFTFSTIATALVLSVLFSYLALYASPWVSYSLRAASIAQSAIPPILLLYLLYFGVLSLWQEHAQLWYLSGTGIAWLSLSVYTAAGINNIVVSQVDNSQRLSYCQRFLYHRVGISAQLINLAKASGMASVIASPNAVLIINSLSSSSDKAFILMSFLAGFYYLLVLACSFIIHHLFYVASAQLSNAKQISPPQSTQENL